MNDILISVQNALPRIFGYDFPRPINWTIKVGEHWCVVGPNASGKTMLADFITGKYAVKSGDISYPFWTDEYKKQSGKTFPTETIRKVSFESAYLLSDYKNLYYQQRFHALENETTPTVSELLTSLPDAEYVQWLCGKLRLEPLSHKHLIMLSSGELRRLLIVLALAQRPKLIIFDNPFIGLDATTRKELDDFFVELSSFQQLMFLVPAVNEIPKVSTHILKAENLEYREEESLEKFVEEQNETLSSVEELLPENLPFGDPEVTRPCEYVLKMNHVSVSYKGNPLYKDLSWEIRRGEKWALLGKNGSGKSTLLSLLAADNPKAYSLDITIFDKKRGTGESIWDIKKPIGYISSEMHLYFQENQSCLKIVSSGLFDTIGLFRNCSPEQEELAFQWMKLLGIDYLKDKSFLKVSGGEQRMVLFARTLVKNPDLLILDEPLHGLDIKHKSLCRSVIEKYCKQEGKTMIYVTHRREEIPSCVNHVFELKKEGA